MIPATWIPHRRPDGETLGWIEPVGDDFVAHDLLGRPATDAPVDWIAAEEALEEIGIRYLADPYTLETADGPRPVRVGEATIDGITLVADDFGSAGVVGSEPEVIRVSFPAPDTLRPTTPTA